MLVIPAEASLKLGKSQQIDIQPFALLPLELEAVCCNQAQARRTTQAFHKLSNRAAANSWHPAAYQISPRFTCASSNIPRIPAVHGRLAIAADQIAVNTYQRGPNRTQYSKLRTANSVVIAANCQAVAEYQRVGPMVTIQVAAIAINIGPAAQPFG